MRFAVIILIDPTNNLVWEVLSIFLNEKNWLELNLWFKNHLDNIVMTLG